MLAPVPICRKRLLAPSLPSLALSTLPRPLSTPRIPSESFYADRARLRARRQQPDSDHVATLDHLRVPRSGFPDVPDLDGARAAGLRTPSDFLTPSDSVRELPTPSRLVSQVRERPAPAKPPDVVPPVVSVRRALANKPYVQYLKMKVPLTLSDSQLPSPLPSL